MTCEDGCHSKPERWESRPAKRYADRDAVFCRECKKWIGYRPHWAGKKKQKRKEVPMQQSAE